MLRQLRSAFGLTPSQGENKEEVLEELGRVVPDPRRCVQCGVCSYNCPIGIGVREYARQGFPVQHPDCITCGLCIQVCPRGTLRWETAAHSLIARALAQPIP